MSAEGHGYAFACEVCDDPAPFWRLTRRGDVATSWACAEHLSEVAERLQRDWEITELVVVLSRKAREWAAIERALSDIVATEETTT